MHKKIRSDGGLDLHFERNYQMVTSRFSNEVVHFLAFPSNLTLFLLEITGLLTAVYKDYFRVINYRELLFDDCGDRVAQLLHIELATLAG